MPTPSVTGSYTTPTCSNWVAPPYEERKPWKPCLNKPEPSHSSLRSDPAQVSRNDCSSPAGMSAQVERNPHEFSFYELNASQTLDARRFTQFSFCDDQIVTKRELGVVDWSRSASIHPGWDYDWSHRCVRIHPPRMSPGHFAQPFSAAAGQTAPGRPSAETHQ